MEKENKNSAARIAANNRYNEKAYDRINVAVPKGMKKQIEEHIKNTGDKSVNMFVKRAIIETMERDIADLEEPASVSQAEYWQSVKRIIDRNRAEREERKRQKGK